MHPPLVTRQTLHTCGQMLRLQDDDRLVENGMGQLLEALQHKGPKMDSIQQHHVDRFKATRSRHVTQSPQHMKAEYSAIERGSRTGYGVTSRSSEMWPTVSNWGPASCTIQLASALHARAWRQSTRHVPMTVVLLLHLSRSVVLCKGCGARAGPCCWACSAEVAVKK